MRGDEGGKGEGSGRNEKQSLALKNDEKRKQNTLKTVQTRLKLLPVALLLPWLILVKAGVRVALRIAHMTLWALRGLLSLLRLRSARASARAEAVTPVETALGVGLLDTSPRLGLANTNARRAIFHADVLRVGFVCRLRGCTTPALSERRTRRGRVTLPKTHETLDSLSTVQLRVLAVLARSEVVHSWCMIMLWCVVLIAEIIVRRGRELVLLTVKPATIVV